MKLIKNIYLLIFLIAFTSFSQVIKEITIDECIQLGLDNSKTLKLAKLKIDAAESRTSEIIAGRLPSLKFNGTYTRLSEVDPFQISFQGMSFNISPSILNTYSAKVTLTQPLFTGFRLSSLTKQSYFNEDAVREDLNKDKSQVIFDIKNSYWNLYRAKKYKSVILDNIKILKAHLNDLENFSTKGLATKNDLLKVKVQLSNIELLLIDAEDAIKISEIQLNSLIGLPLDSKLELKSEPKFEDFQLKNSEELINYAIEERADLKSLAYRKKSAETAVSVANSGWYPQLNLSSNYYYSRPNQRIQPAKDEFRSTWDVGLTLNFDIWNWLTTKHQSDQAAALVSQTEQGYYQMKDMVVLDVTQSRLSVQKSTAKLSATKIIVEQAEENYKVTKDKFNNGLAINSDLLDAENTLLQANFNHVSSLVEYLISIAKLDKSIGK